MLAQNTAHSPRLKIFFLIPLLVLVAGTVILAARNAGVGGSAPVIVADQSTQDQRDNLEVELVTLRPEGFEPALITRPRGPFVLLVDDRSGKEGSSLRLQQVKGDNLRAINVTRKKSEWYEQLNLPAGDYVLSDAENPERRCQITVLR